ncbi:Protein O-linked-mannose beta-1,2-N-acetylglucosaminyltransferase 1 [Hondaea fermentalgiana]|uniref:alpha-1,3-mannosyl-glycoprotein 2-beta-N-acetylglucosaminyltransferase n=1 Tax=Hondaea fermentalgiana TaxID=2315210 RepID=A0A2R5GAP9_9STRA|nr:Protein O-linked-mannose beta-1,2-N-acetylglucosaminyltransferase 1 [Hondaea fermentalgiana]|eukprot:GBG28096.1 Protein O-linked-mannose beta-1,2-N-acetylglucosaminyltransferase 1 [Hondaea fermentalgiana]
MFWRSCSGNLGSENDEHQKRQEAATLLRELVSNDEVIPVVVICHSRVEVFRESLASLLGDVRGLDPRKVLVAQDGTNSEVAAVARDEFGLALVQRNRDQDAITPRGNWGRERGAGAHIAAQYRFAIDAGFAHFPSAPALILAEDDLVYSPDFAEFLTRAAALVAEDESLWIASAWNDNGYRGVARDLRRVLRTDFFPGLGWTMQRSLWRQELRLAWPSDHYDWHLRKAEVAKGRECLYPEVARVAHRGWEGSFMDFTHHVRHFAGIVHAQDARYRWRDDDISVGREDAYDAALALTLAHRAWHVRHGEDLLSALTWIPGAVLVIWHRSSLDPRMNFRFRPLARRLGIWEDPRRGARRGVHELWLRNARVILMNVFDVQEKTQKMQDRRGPQGRPMPPRRSAHLCFGA